MKLTWAKLLENFPKFPSKMTPTAVALASENIGDALSSTKKNTPNDLIDKDIPHDDVDGEDDGEDDVAVEGGVGELLSPLA